MSMQHVVVGIIFRSSSQPPPPSCHLISIYALSNYAGLLFLMSRLGLCNDRQSQRQGKTGPDRSRQVRGL